VSFDANRAVWAARDAGELEGGPRLLVALAMADRAHNGSGEFQAGIAGLAHLLGLGRSTVVREARGLQASGFVEVTRPGMGTRPTRWRWLLEPPAQRSQIGTETASAHPGDNNAQSSQPGTLTDSLRSPKARQPSHMGTIAVPTGTQTRTRVYNQGDAAAENGDAAPEKPPAHLRNGVDPSEVPGRVAALRDALTAPRPPAGAEDPDEAPFRSVGS
jgi:hypothetical protein